MAKPIRRTEIKKRAPREGKLPLGRKNVTIIACGIVAIIAGYLAMLNGSVEGALSLVVAPILLVLGYCVLIPLGILYRGGRKDTPAAGEPKQA